MSTLYVLKEGRETGPLTTEELGKKVADGVFSRDDLYWTEGMQDWRPLAEVVETVPDEDSGAGESELTVDVGEILYREGEAFVTAHAVHPSEGDAIPLAGISTVAVQCEKVKRFRPVVGCVLLGVLLVCVVLLDIPRTTVTHWIIWGVVLLALVLCWLRFVLATLRIPTALVVIDLLDGSERIVRVKPAAAQPLCDAIEQARADVEVEDD